MVAPDGANFNMCPYLFAGFASADDVCLSVCLCFLSPRVWLTIEKMLELVLPLKEVLLYHGRTALVFAPNYQY